MKTSMLQLPPGLLCLLASCAPGLAAPAWPSSPQTIFTANSAGQHGAVASESDICSRIGIELLAKGGNAVDAYIGAQLCVGVMGMHHSGIGGGGFTLVRDLSGSYVVVDYRESAPAAAFQDMYKDNVKGSVFGGLAVGTPGELRGLEYLHTKFGKLPWSSVVMPASNVARDGVKVNEDIVRYMNDGIQYAGYNFLVEDPSWALDFAPEGKLLQIGETLYRKRYAATLEQVALHGADYFYTGALAEAIINSIHAENGTMTLEDLASYRPIIRPALSSTYRNYTLYTSGAPSSGAVCLSALKTMETYDTADTSDVNLTIHRFDEAMRFAYAARQELGDPAFLPASSVARLEAEMLDPENSAKIRSRILDNTTQPVDHYNPKRIYLPESHGTSHIVAIDSSGMAVSGTTTINLLFGSLIMDRETGVILNNEMNDFSIPDQHNEFGYAPSPSNYIRPGKRPLSSITPLIVEHENQTLFAVVGAAGGSRIISSTTQVIWRVLEEGMNMTEAMRAPRFHDQLMPNTMVVEAEFDEGMVASLREKGHNMTVKDIKMSSVQGIRVTGKDTFEAVGEPRQKNSGGMSI